MIYADSRIKLKDRLQKNTTELYVRVTLPKLPNRVFQIYLIKLDCCNIGLEELPEELGNMVSLKELLLGCNKLKRVPKSLGQLKALYRLDLSFNQITQLPSTLSRLQLSYLGLEFNKLKTFPKGLGSKIHTLNLDVDYSITLPCFGNASVVTNANFCSKYYCNDLVRLPRKPGRPELAAINCSARSWTLLPLK